MAAAPGTNCRNAQDEQWTVFSLKEEVDKTLTGEWREMSPGGVLCDQAHGEAHAD